MTMPHTQGFPSGSAVPPWQPQPPERPGHPGYPGQPGHPGPFPWQPGPAPGPDRPNPALQPTRVWLDPGGWPEGLYDRLLAQRIVMAHGYLDGEAATRLCAQLLTLDAEGTRPIRLELQNLDADLPAALSVMGVLDVVRGPVSAYAGGRIQGPALGILAASRHRWAYPNALFALSEPQVSFGGTVSAVAAREDQARAMLDELFTRVAQVTGRDLDEIRADARRDRLFSVAEAVAYGLVEGRATARRLPELPGFAGLPGERDEGGGDGGPGAGHDQPGGDGHGDA